MSHRHKHKELSIYFHVDIQTQSRRKENTYQRLYYLTQSRIYFQERKGKKEKKTVPNRRLG